MSYEYFLKINKLIYNLLCFPQGVMSIIVPNTLGVKKFP